MHTRRRLLLFLSSIGVAVGVLTHAQPPPPTFNLLQASDFTYVGSFRLPSGNYGSLNDSSTYANGWVGGLVYNDPTNGKSLFIKGDQASEQVSKTSSMAQITIPTLLDVTVVGVSGLNTGTHVQGFADASGGKSSSIMVGPGHGASVVYNGKLIGTEVTLYDGFCAQTQFGWVGTPAFGNQTGGYTTTTIPVSPRFLGGFLTKIPSTYTANGVTYNYTTYTSGLGGTLIAGGLNGGIAGCGPNGPGLFALDGDTLATQPATTTHITTVPLVYYDNTHANLGAWNSTSPTQNCTTSGGTWPNSGGQCTNSGNVPTITLSNAHTGLPNQPSSYTMPFGGPNGDLGGSGGVLFAENTRSVLVFGAKGLGAFFYKPCTVNTWPVPNGTCDGPPCNDSTFAGHPYAYDPDAANCTKFGGDFSWPSTEFVWAFDVNDLMAVKNGTKNPYDVVPYTGWSFKTPNDGDGNGVGCGVAWDSTLRYVYLVCEEEDSNRPLVHAYSVGIP